MHLSESISRQKEIFLLCHISLYFDVGRIGSLNSNPSLWSSYLKSSNYSTRQTVYQISTRKVLVIVSLYEESLMGLSNSKKSVKTFCLMIVLFLIFKKLSFHINNSFTLGSLGWNSSCQLLAAGYEEIVFSGELIYTSKKW